MSLSSSKLVSQLPPNLPLLLIGAGLANTSLAQTLRLTGYYNPTQVRIFDKFKSTTSPSYSWTAHDWATDKLDELTGKGQTSFFSSTVVDGDVGGTGVVEDRLMELTTGEPLGDVRIRGKEGEKSMRVGRGSVRNMLNQGLEIEFERTFERFERVRDEDGNEAIRAYFEGGHEVLGCAIVAGDGVHSPVRKQLLPSVQPTILPVVCYTGKFPVLPEMVLAEKIKTPANDVYTTLAADNALFCFGFNTFQRKKVEAQWTYLRKPLEGKEDPLWKPERSLDAATEIPDEVFEEIAVLAKTANEDYKGMMSKIVKGDKGSTKYNWLLRSLRIGSPEEVEKMKSEVEGGERVFLIGDAAHAMPIVQGDGGNHAILDGVNLGLFVAAAFNAQARSTEPNYSPLDSPLLKVLKKFHAKEAPRWEEGLKQSEERLLRLFKPIEEWKRAGGEADV